MTTPVEPKKVVSFELNPSFNDPDIERGKEKKLLRTETLALRKQIKKDNYAILIIGGISILACATAIVLVYGIKLRNKDSEADILGYGGLCGIIIASLFLMRRCFRAHQMQIKVKKLRELEAEKPSFYMTPKSKHNSYHQTHFTYHPSPAASKVEENRERKYTIDLSNIEEEAT